MPRLIAWVARVCRSRCGGGEQAHQFGVQRHIAVFADLAQRNAQPVPGADPHHRVGVQVGQLPGPHPGAGQQFDHEPVTRVGAGPGGGHQPGGVAVVEEFRQRLGFLGDVPGDDIEDYKVWLAAQPRGGGQAITSETHRQRMRTIRQFFERIIEWDWPGADPHHRIGVQIG